MNRFMHGQLHRFATWHGDDLNHVQEILEHVAAVADGNQL